jgi:hypothetical protein
VVGEDAPDVVVLGHVDDEIETGQLVDLGEVPR